MTAVSDSTPCSLIDALAGHGAKPALLVLREGGMEHWSYADLGERVQRLAQGLRHAGIARGESIALFGPDRPEWIMAALAVIRSGAAALPLDAQLGDEVLSHILADSGARFIFTTADRVERLQRLAPELTVILLDATAGEARGWQARLAAGEAPAPSADAQDVAALFYTSGTTGPPKGVPLTHANLAFQIDALARAGVLWPGDRVALPLPLHHVYPFVLGVLLPLAMGLTLVIPQALTGPQVLRALHEGEATVMVGVPRLFAALVAGIEARVAARGRFAVWLVQRLLELSMVLRRLGLGVGRSLFRSLHAQLAPHLRLLTCGGAALDPHLAAQLDGLGWQVAIGYGLTETSPLLAMNLPGTQRPLDNAGPALPGVMLRIEAAPGSRDGEILARGPNVFAGYRNQPDMTRAAFTADGWFRTGDLGYFDAAGNLHISGRVKELIVTAGGENVQPEAVETAYQRHPCIREFALLERQGKLVGLVLPEAGEIRRRGHADIDAAIRAALAEVSRGLPSYQRVTDCAITRDPLPRTRLGKLRRHLLPDSFEQARAQQQQPAGAERKPLPIEQMAESDRLLLENPPGRLTWAWLAERFPQRRLTPDTSLRLDLAVDSIDWLGIALDIEQRTGVELGEEAICRVDTVRDLLREVGTAPSASAAHASWEQPETVLDPAQARWLQPLGALAGALSWGLSALVWIGMRLLFRLHVQGMDQLPASGQLVLCPNHVSLLDPFAVAAALGPNRARNIYWGGWTGIVFTNPVLRLACRLGRVLPVTPERGAMSSLALGAAILKRGDGLVWFPEGERSPGGTLQAFRPGIGLLLARFPALLVPVYIHGSFEAMPRGQRWARPHAISVVFGAPIAPAELARQGTGKNESERIVSALRERVVALQTQFEAARK